MSRERLFGPADLQVLDRISERAEELVGDYYHLPAFGPRRYLYEVATYRTLGPVERAEGAFAQLCRYVKRPPVPGDRRRADRYYRICLQDPQILAAVHPEGTPFGLQPLLLYIFTHELIHIVRFEQFEHPFVTEPEGRQAEERAVHQVTYDLLSGVEDPEIEALLDYYRTHRMPRCL